MSRSYAARDLKLLWGLAAARCSFPECRTEMVAESSGADPAAVLGEVAHIVAASDEGPRADPDLPAGDRHNYENLILLCPNHHTLVDKQENTHTVDDLRRWKSQHELWVREQLALEMPSVSFAELEILTQGILNAPEVAPEEFVTLAPPEKMAKNGLTERIRFELTMGLSKVREVSRFFTSVSVADAAFPEKLKAGFVNEYRRLKMEDIEGDALFEALRDFASLGSREFRDQAAGLAVLAFLFESCKVFER